MYKLKYPYLPTFAALDFHVLVTLLFRCWIVAAGGATVFLLPLWLSPIAQGYYFTFASLLSLQIFFELGLNQIVMQLVSHEVAHLKETEDGYLAGKESHLGRLSSLVHFLQHWYGRAALFFALTAGVAGAVFFMRKGEEPVSMWLGAWVTLVVTTAVNLRLSPGLAVFEGCGKVGQVARLRLMQSVLGYACLWIALLAGAELWAATAVPLLSALCTNYWLKSNGNLLGWLSNRTVGIQNLMSWRIDIFPLQWRVALSWVCGYLIFNLFTPAVFSIYGAVEAGKLGMALTVFSSISNIGMSWLNAKAPNFTMHIARGERRQLNILFRALFIRSTAATILLSAGVVLVAIDLNSLDQSIMGRVASPDILAILAAVTVANSLVFAMAMYMRAHREEPMLTQSLVFGMLTVLIVYFGSKVSIFAMMFSYMLACIFISVPWTVHLFRRYFIRADSI
jgi:hypothetical protein